MTKVMRYENGKAITGQVDAPFKVDWSEWQSMTDSQKKGKKWLIENVPGAEGEIEADLMTKLWENPAPTSTFAAQIVTLSSDDYDFLYIYGYKNVSYPGMGVEGIIGPKDKPFSLTCFIPTAPPEGGLRSVTPNGNKVTFTDASYYTSGSGAVTANGRLVPIAIYGIKSTVKIKFDALAKDVSTLASKCILEDGETSVEEELTKSVTTTVITSGTTTSTFSWTASEDCIIVVSGKASQIQVNGVTLFADNPNNSAAVQGWAFAKKGDSVNIKGSTSWGTYYYIYKMR